MYRQPFCDQWRFRREDELNWTQVSLPHDAMLHGKRSAESPATHAGAFFEGGVYVYEKSFDAPEAWREKTVSFEFEGIYRNARIYVNDVLVGERPYGYVPFTVCVSDLLRYGEENVLRVVADNSQLPNSRWYSGSGIYRPVNLLVGNKTHLVWEGLRIKTLSAIPAEIAVEAEIECAQRQDLTLKVEILDGQAIIVSQQVPVEGSCARTRLSVHNAKPWSAETPKLYDCRITLLQGEAVLDQADETFGIRSLRYGTDGLFVNGKRTLLKGGCIHSDNGILGACTYPEAEERKVRILKDAGYNALRISHNPASRYLLEACDRYGMYVMDEAFDMWYIHKNRYDYASAFSTWHLRDLEAMVRRDVNHPSVIMYSIGNEVTEPYQEKGVATAKEMVRFLHELDPDRIVTAGINLMILNKASQGKGIYKEEPESEAPLKAARKPEKKQKEKASGSLFFNMLTSKIGTRINGMANGKKADEVTSPVLDALDVAGYNYASGRYRLEQKVHPSRVIVGSETFPQDIKKNWDMVESLPYLIGDFMWTAWDYIGEAACGAWNYRGTTMFNVTYPWLLADVGVFDILGNPGAQAEMTSIVWNQKQGPYIGVRPVNHPGVRVSKAVWRGTNAFASWSWKNCEGNRAEVEVYARAHEAELFVNGKSIGKKPLKDYKTLFTTRYTPGTLLAVVYDKAGKEVGRKELCSGTGETAIAAHVEPGSSGIGAVRYIDIALVGENGIVESNDDRKLTVTVENGELLGFGSANPCTEERFETGSYTTYYGRALAAIRLTGQEATVHITGPGLEEKIAVVHN